MITTTKEEITDAFAIWHQQYSDAPEDFASFEDGFSAEQCSDYFLSILEAIQGCKQCTK